MASEMYGRALHGNGWRTNSSYFGTLDCEVRPGTTGCGGGNFVMLKEYVAPITVNGRHWGGFRTAYQI